MRRPWPGRSRDSRDESADERADRNLGELLQELRVAGLGVQVLFGFLLSLPFTNRFSKLSNGQRGLYLADLLLAAIATALLLGPVAYHRLVFRRGEKEQLVRAANVMAIAGAMASIIHDSGPVARLKARGLQRAAQFSWVDAARLTLQVYDDVLAC